MSWWLILFIILDIIAGILAGLVLSYFILKKQGKKLPSLFLKIKKPTRIKTKPALLTQGNSPKIESKSTILKSTKKEAVPEVTAAKPGKEISADQASVNVNSPVFPDNNALIEELEGNLVIAGKPAGEKLIKFQTGIWSLKQPEFQSIKVPFLPELEQAYVDMLLANNLAWLVTDLGHDNPDFKASYSELKNRISIRLKRIIPKVKSLSEG